MLRASDSAVSAGISFMVRQRFWIVAPVKGAEAARVAVEMANLMEDLT